MNRLTGIICIVGAVLLAYVLIMTDFAQAGARQDYAVSVASVATGMPPASWRLDVTDDMPENDWGYWDSNVDPFAARVRPLSEFHDNYALWCTVIVHEAWHIKNQNGEHSPDPNNVLYPEFPTPTHYLYPPCKFDPLHVIMPHRPRMVRSTFDTR